MEVEQSWRVVEVVVQEQMCGRRGTRFMNGRVKILKVTRKYLRLLFSSFDAQTHFCCGSKTTDALQTLAERAFVISQTFAYIGACS